MISCKQIRYGKQPNEEHGTGASDLKYLSISELDGPSRIQRSVRQIILKIAVVTPAPCEAVSKNDYQWADEYSSNRVCNR